MSETEDKDYLILNCDEFWNASIDVAANNFVEAEALVTVNTGVAENESTVIVIKEADALGKVVITKSQIMELWVNTTQNLNKNGSALAKNHTK